MMSDYLKEGGGWQEVPSCDSHKTLFIWPHGEGLASSEDVKYVFNLGLSLYLHSSLVEAGKAPIVL
jgi:hypothetical protein